MPETSLDEQLEDALRNKSQELIPDSLRSLLEAEYAALVQKTRERIALKEKACPNQKLTAEEEARFALEIWTREKLRQLAYSEYCEFMAERQMEPISEERFYTGIRENNGKKRRTSDRNPACEKWLTIKEKGLREGSRVFAHNPHDKQVSIEVASKDKKKRGTVESFNNTCDVRLLMDETGELDRFTNPYFVHPLDEE